MDDESGGGEGDQRREEEAASQHRHDELLGSRQAPRPLARRVILPALLFPIFRGAPSKTLALAARRFFSRFAGDDKADAAIDVALWAVASCGALPFALLGYVAFKAFEKSRTPPKRTKDKKAKKAKKAD